MIITIVIVSIALMALFIVAAIAGGKAHDRANEIAAQRTSKLTNHVDTDREQKDG